MVKIDVLPDGSDGILPDDILLIIFDFYIGEYQDGHTFEAGRPQGPRIKSWQLLVHVCRRWRGLVFGSPRHLNLQLYCTTTTPARETLEVWPTFPLHIQGGVSETSVDNVIAQLKQSDRILQIQLNLFFDTARQIEKLWTAMQVPFPELAALYLSFGNISFVPILPDSFLGGSAPHLQHLALNSISFPALPKLLLTATHLVSLYLCQIPHSGYISPEAMITYLSMLTSLETLEFRFKSPQSSPDQGIQRSSLPTRSLLPAFTVLRFKGDNEYLEDLVSRIDAPKFLFLSATVFNDIVFDTPELIRFISRSSTFKAPNGAHLFLDSLTASFKLQLQASDTQDFEVTVLCREPNWQLSFLAQICATSFPLLSTTEILFIDQRPGSQLDWKNGIENIEWLELLLPFTAVKYLYLSKEIAPHIAPALQGMAGGGTTEVLSSLQNLYLEGFDRSLSAQEGIKRFISARQLTNRPVAISAWRKGWSNPKDAKRGVQVTLDAIDDIRFCEKLFGQWMTEINKCVVNHFSRRHVTSDDNNGLTESRAAPISQKNESK